MRRFAASCEAGTACYGVRMRLECQAGKWTLHLMQAMEARNGELEDEWR